MDYLFGINWGKAFSFDTSPLEIILRGTIVYLAVFVLLRSILKRESGGVGITDLLVIVLIADAAQNAMAGTYTSVPDGLVLVATIVFWAYALDWLAHRYPAISRLIKPQPLLLVRDGRMLRRNMAQELITEEELLSQVRLQGNEELTNVKAAYMEPDGRISVISKNENGGSGAPEKSIS
jgi:uncharacterized membrane protein YcaP (DUF421 family)